MKEDISIFFNEISYACLHMDEKISIFINKESLKKIKDEKKITTEKMVEKCPSINKGKLNNIIYGKTRRLTLKEYLELSFALNVDIKDLFVIEPDIPYFPSILKNWFSKSLAFKLEKDKITSENQEVFLFSELMINNRILDNVGDVVKEESKPLLIELFNKTFAVVKKENLSAKDYFEVCQIIDKMREQGI